MVNIDIGIDLGTSNTVIYIKDKGIVVNQPSVVAYEAKSKKIIAVGNKAKKMLGKTPEDIEVTRPIRNGVISDYIMTERMLKIYVKSAIAKGYFKQQGFKTDDSVEGTVKNLLMAMESGNIDRMLKACDEAMLKCDDREKAKGSSRKYLLSEDFK